VIVSLLYTLSRRLVSVPAVVLRPDASKDAEPLVPCHENTILRRQITGRIQPTSGFEQVQDRLEDVQKCVRPS
jgi:hypothetical protein